MSKQDKYDPGFREGAVCVSPWSPASRSHRSPATLASMRPRGHALAWHQANACVAGAALTGHPLLRLHPIRLNVRHHWPVYPAASGTSWKYFCTLPRRHGSRSSCTDPDRPST